jgi:hypothetical protein
LFIELIKFIKEEAGCFFCVSCPSGQAGLVPWCFGGILFSLKIEHWELNPSEKSDFATKSQKHQISPKLKQLLAGFGIFWWLGVLVAYSSTWNSTSSGRKVRSKEEHGFWLVANGYKKCSTKRLNDHLTIKSLWK